MTRRVPQLRRVDDHIDGRELRPLAERKLRATAGLLRHAVYTDPIGRALLGAVAELPLVVENGTAVTTGRSPLR